MHRHQIWQPLFFPKMTISYTYGFRFLINLFFVCFVKNLFHMLANCSAVNPLITGTRAAWTQSSPRICCFLNCCQTFCSFGRIQKKTANKMVSANISPPEARLPADVCIIFFVITNCGIRNRSFLNCRRHNRNFFCSACKYFNPLIVNILTCG